MYEAIIANNATKLVTICEFQFMLIVVIYKIIRVHGAKVELITA